MNTSYVRFQENPIPRIPRKSFAEFWGIASQHSQEILLRIAGESLSELWREFLLRIRGKYPVGILGGFVLRFWENVLQDSEGVISKIL